MLRVRRPERVVAPALGDLARDPLERLAPAVVELEPDVRPAAQPLVEVLLRVADVGARQRRVVLDHPEAVGIRGVGARLLVAHHEDALGDLEHLGALALGVVEVLQRGLAAVRRLAVVQRPLRDLVEGVEARTVGGVVVAVALRIAPGRLPHRLEEPRDRLPGVGVLVRVDPAGLVQDAGFPVIEEQLRGRPHLLGRALGVLHAGQVHLDLTLARLQQLRLGHAERVHALAHDVQRPLQRLRRDGRLLSGPLRLVDQLHAALEIEPELRVALVEHHQRGGDQPQDEEQDED